MLLRLKKAGEILVIIAVIIGVALLGAFWEKAQSPTQDSNSTVEAAPAPALKDVGKLEITPKHPIKVYAGGKKTKQKLKLPPSVVSQDSQQVLAGIKLDMRDDHPRTITTMLDTETGESSSYITKEPLPWLAVDTRGSIGAYAGFKNATPTLRLEAKQSLLQIKNVHIRATASIDQPLQGAIQQDYFVGIGAEVHW